MTTRSDICPLGPAWERPLDAGELSGMLALEPALLPGLPEPIACVRGMRLYAAGEACGRAIWNGGEGAALTASVCALGAFDGVHVGHRALVEATVAEARSLGVPAIAVTFDPDPADVLAGPRPSTELLPIADRIRVLLALGLDGVLVVPFTAELAATSHADFMASWLVPAAHPASVHVGTDFRMGRGGAGDVTALSEVGARIGMAVRPHDLVRSLGETVSATRVRGLVRSGDVEGAARLLRRYHAVSGTVVHGRGDGTAFGFPTANVECDAAACLPAEGVYAAVALVDGHAWPAAVNVGKPVTFGGERGAAFMEATLVGFSGNLYDRPATVCFVTWLREPRKFASLDELERTVLGNIEWVRRYVGAGEVSLVARDGAAGSGHPVGTVAPADPTVSTGTATLDDRDGARP